MEQHELDSLIAQVNSQEPQDADVRAQNIATLKEFFPKMKQLADAGDCGMALNVGSFLTAGEVCEENPSEALRYFLMAADKGIGNVKAKAALCAAAFLESGTGCKVDSKKAKQYYEIAALAGSPQAQWGMARMGMLMNDPLSFHWACCAAIGGVPEAVNMLADMKSKGMGKAVDLRLDLIRKHGVNPNDIPKQGCYIATCVYGSYDCPQVWTLRRFRDITLAGTWYGRAFIRTYYAISPTLVRWFGDCAWFQKFWKGILNPFVAKLQKQGVDSRPYQDQPW